MNAIKSKFCSSISRLFGVLEEAREVRRKLLDLNASVKQDYPKDLDAVKEAIRSYEHKFQMLQDCLSGIRAGYEGEKQCRELEKKLEYEAKVSDAQKETHEKALMAKRAQKNELLARKCDREESVRCQAEISYQQQLEAAEERFAEAQVSYERLKIRYDDQLKDGKSQVCEYEELVLEDFEADSEYTELRVEKAEIEQKAKMWKEKTGSKKKEMKKIHEIKVIEITNEIAKLKEVVDDLKSKLTENQKKALEAKKLRRQREKSSELVELRLDIRRDLGFSSRPNPTTFKCRPIFDYMVKKVQVPQVASKVAKSEGDTDALTSRNSVGVMRPGKKMMEVLDDDDYM